jgi:1,4-dihydroxy-2-naphthoyl-CoA hydrolase
VTDEIATSVIREWMPLCSTLGITADVYSAEKVVLAVAWSPELCTSNGVLHGGVIMTLADSAGAACAFLNLPEGATGTSTIESKTNFVGAVKGGTVTATSTPLHLGSTTIVVETSVRDSTGRLVAKVTQTQLVIRPRS